MRARWRLIVHDLLKIGIVEAIADKKKSLFYEQCVQFLLDTRSVGGMIVRLCNDDRVLLVPVPM